MRVLITGHSSPISKRVGEYLTANGYDVSYTSRREIRPNIHYLDLAKASQDDLSKLCSKQFNSILHFAAVKSATNSRARDIGTLVNVDKTVALAHAAIANGCRQFIFMSSAAVYGSNTHDQPFKTTSPCLPESWYGRSKLAAESQLNILQEQYNTYASICSIRAPSIYGRELGGTIHRLSQYIEAGVPLPYLSTQNSRSVLSVTNLAEAIIQLLRSSTKGPRTINVTDPEPLSTAALVRLIASAKNRPLRQLHLPEGFIRFLLRSTGLNKFEKSLYQDHILDIGGSSELIDFRQFQTTEDALLELYGSAK